MIDQKDPFYKIKPWKQKIECILPNLHTGFLALNQIKTTILYYFHEIISVWQCHISLSCNKLVFTFLKEGVNRKTTGNSSRRRYWESALFCGAFKSEGTLDRVVLSSNLDNTSVRTRTKMASGDPKLGVADSWRKIVYDDMTINLK